MQIMPTARHARATKHHLYQNGVTVTYSRL
jgi:hypothetical protein